MKRKANPLVSDDSIQAILEIASAYRKSKILLTACELDIFTHLGNESKTAKELSILTDTNEKALTRLLNALTVMNLLVKSGDKYSNTKGTRNFLVKGEPHYIGNLQFIAQLWYTWEHLTESVKIGTAALYKDIEDKDDCWIESFVESQHHRSLLQAPDVIKLIDLSNVNSILDLGCGSGLYSMEFLKIKPSLKVTAFDFPKVIKQTEKILGKEGFLEKIELKGGNFFNDSIGKGYDLVFISMVLHHFSLWENIKLLETVYDALNPGGMVIIQDWILNKDTVTPASAALLSLNLLVNTKTGDVMTESEFYLILREAWFRNIVRIDTEFGTSIIKANKMKMI